MVDYLKLITQGQDGASKERARDKDQEPIIETIQGNIAINAGAGTGKTRTLTNRIVYALASTLGRSKPILPANILAITYTNAAAAELKNRVESTLRELTKLSDGPDASALMSYARNINQAWISTMHSFCVRVLRENAFEISMNPFFRLVDEVESLEMFNQAFDEIQTEVGEFLLDVQEDYFDSNVDHLSRCPVGRIEAAIAQERSIDTYMQLSVHNAFSTIKDNVRQILGQAQTYGLKAEDIVAAPIPIEAESDLAQVNNYITRARTAKLAREVQERYQLLKDEAGVVDFADLLIRTKRMFEDFPNIREKYSEQFSLIMIDEFQDTNRLQYKIFEMLSNENMCTVGDEKQSIFRFQGADVDVIREVEATRKPAEIRPLSNNYRSHPEIIEFTNELFAHKAFFGPDMQTLSSRFETSSESKTPAIQEALRVVPRVNLVGVPSGTSGGKTSNFEGLLVAEHLSSLHVQGCSYSDMVVLVRTRTVGKEVVAELTRKGIPALVQGGSELLKQPVVRLIKRFLAVVINPQDDEALLSLMISDFGRVSDETLAVLAHIKRARAEGDGYPVLWDLLQSDAIENETEKQNLREFYRTIDASRNQIGATGISHLLAKAFAARHMFDRYIQNDVRGKQDWADFQRIQKLADEFDRSEGNIVDFPHWLESLEALKVKLEPGIWLSDNIDYVRIMTLHGSKGLEFPIVAVVMGEGYIKPKTPLSIHHTSSHAQDADFQSAMSGASASTQTQLASAKLADKLVISMSTKKESEGAEEVFRDYFEKKESDELKRLFYVGCTRAVNSLFVTYSYGPEKDVPKLKYVGHAIHETMSAVACEDNESNIDAWTRKGVNFRVYSLPEIEEEYGENIAENVPRLTSQSVLLHDSPTKQHQEPSALIPRMREQFNRISYSHLSEYDGCPWRFWWSSVKRIGKLEAKDVESSTFRGTVTHALLEKAVIGQLTPQVRESIFGANAVPPEDRQELDNLADVFMKSELGKRLSGFKHIETERQFYVALNDESSSDVRYLYGYIDALGIDSDGNALVVDYKISSKDELGIEKYVIQAKCYALAMLKSGATSTSVVFAHVTEEGVTPYEGSGAYKFTYSVSQMAELQDELLYRIRCFDALNDCKAIQEAKRWSSAKGEHPSCWDSCQIEQPEMRPCMVKYDSGACATYCSLPKAMCSKRRPNKI